jgi:hypothetical protein
MKNRTAKKTRPASLSARGLGNLPLSYLVVIAICGCLIAAGFLLAARQHFMSMDLGMKNSKLRKQLEDLETEQRRLMLAREVALSPKEITKTARNLGFVDTLEQMLATPVPVLKNGNPPSTNATVVKASAPSASPAAVTKTAYQRPVEPVAKSDTSKKPASHKSSRNG